MDRRSWPWKRKSSAEKAIAALDSAGVALPSEGSQSEKDNHIKTNYVQISVEQYTHLTGLEDQLKAYKDQVKTYEDKLKVYEDQRKTHEDQLKAYDDQVKTYEDQFKTLEEQIEELNEKLSDAHTEISCKEERVKQHSKVAEEAVSGWEKAEAESGALRTQLEAVAISKLTAEERAAHLDGAMKECMRQIRNLKEEHEQKIQDIVLAKNKHCDNIKCAFEARIGDLDQELFRAEAENAALSRSLNERSSMLIKISEEKSRAETQIELLKGNVESCEREINSLKYELHISAKELEIRNEEKNMSVKSAEAANKQFMEGVKKIAKLEAECQRLRGLVRKKLPGPAAFAQMKLEVESLGRENGETRTRRSSTRPNSPHASPHPRLAPVTEFFLDGAQKFQKQNEFLTERLLAMEEETKMLKEALAKRNSELQTSRSVCAMTASKLQSLEAQLHIVHQQKASMKGDTFPLQNTSNRTIMASAAEVGNDDAANVDESWNSASASELSHIKDKIKDRPRRTDSANHLELMDDFLEMEKMAHFPKESKRDTSIECVSVHKKSEMTNGHGFASGVELAVEKSESDLMSKSSCEKCVATNLKEPVADPSVMMKVRSRILMVFESFSVDSDLTKLLDEIKCIVQEVDDTLHQHSVSCVFEEKHCSEVAATEKEVSLHENGSPGVKNELLLPEDLIAATSQIHTFILSLGREAKAFEETSGDNEVKGLNHKVELFCASYNKVLCNETSLEDFVLALSGVVVEASDLNFRFLGHSSTEAEVGSPDCIDKIALPENKTSSGQRYSVTCSQNSDSSSNPEVPQEDNMIHELENPCKCSLDECMRMKAEKERTEKELAGCMEDLETTKSQLHEAKELLAEVRRQLATSGRTNSLSDTQLKCMAESYKSLEKRAEEFESEVNLLRSKLQSLETELQSEKASNQDALARCRDLEEQLQRSQEDSSSCSCPSSHQDTTKINQEKELAAAAEKLAECQETILLLGRHLKSLQPETDKQRNQREEDGFMDDGPTTSTTATPTSISGMAQLVSNQSDVDAGGGGGGGGGGSASLWPAGAEYTHNSPTSPSEIEVGDSLGHSQASKQMSGSSSASSTPTPEKQSRGFSRFFSSKGRSSH